MKKKVLSVLLASAMVFSLAACGNKSEGDSAAADTKDDAAAEETTDDAAAETDSAADASGIRVACVYSGLLGDKSYNDSCHEGLMKAQKDFGVEVKELEGTTADEWEENLLAVCVDGYDLVIFYTSTFDEYMKK